MKLQSVWWWTNRGTNGLQGVCCKILSLVAEKLNFNLLMVLPGFF